MIDCELLAKVYINLIDQKEPTLNFQNQEIRSFEENKSKVFYFKKVIKPSSDEIRKHTAYLKSNLKKIFLIKSFIV